MRLLIKLFLTVSLVLACQVSAADDQAQFTVSWPVNDRSPAAKKVAEIEALQEVIVRSSGTIKALDAQYVQESFKKSQSFLRTFQYKEVTDPFDQTTQLTIVFQFDGKAIERLLQDSAVPMWSGRRPVSLFWIAYEQDYERKVINASQDQNDPIISLLDFHSKRRGLPKVLPLMDLEDSMNISPSDIWGRFPEPVITASQRYGSEAIVAGRLTETNNLWTSRFFMDINGKRFYQDFEGESENEIIRSLTEWLGEALCDVYCVYESETNNNQWQLSIKDIRSFSAYRVLLNYLEQLSAIRKVEVIEINEQHLRVVVDLVGDVGSLIQAIELDSKLIPIGEGELDASIQLDKNILNYRWRP